MVSNSNLAINPYKTNELQEPAKIIDINRNKNPQSDVTPLEPFVYTDYDPSSLDSAFAKHNLYYQRAILEEANIQLHGFKTAEPYKERMKDPKVVTQVLGYYCEKYAKDRDLLNNNLENQQRNYRTYHTSSELYARFQKDAHGVAKRLEAGYTPENDKLNKIINKQPVTRITQNYITAQKQSNRV